MNTIAGADIRWQDFCDSHSYRYPGHKTPFVHSGMKVATDGVIIVAMPTDEPDSPRTKECRRVDPSDILAPVLKFTGKVEPLPIVAPCDCVVYPAEGEQIVCPECKGQLMIECEECDGTGKDECQYCCQDVECVECDGEGELECYVCQEGFVTRELLSALRCKCVVSVGGMAIAGRYFDRIAQLPDVGFHVPNQKKHLDQLWFRFAGNGIGLVMQIITVPTTKWRPAR